MNFKRSMRILLKSLAGAGITVARSMAGRAVSWPQTFLLDERYGSRLVVDCYQGLSRGSS